MRRSGALVAACSLMLVAGAVTTVSASASTPRTSASGAKHSLIKYQGQRAALPRRGTTSKASTKAAAPRGTSLRNEVKLFEVQGEEDTQGGKLVKNGYMNPPVAGSVPVSASTRGVVSRFEGLNHFDSRYSGGGNAYSGEPPDQGLCVNDKYVFEIVNSVVQVYTKSGHALIAGDKAFADGPKVGLTLNEFYDLPPSIDRVNGTYGPFMFDTSCLYDYRTQRWFATAANLDQDPATGDFTGDNQVWIAVSKTSNPLGAWNIWSVDTTNNGLNGTPNHGCLDAACFGDYPQIGMDANGFYLTTNEFEFFGDGFNGSQVYALSKKDLVVGDHSPTYQLFENVPTQTFQDVAYTMQPANALPRDWARSNGGTMYFGMSGSAFKDGLVSKVAMYSLTNTSSLRTSSPALTLTESAVKTQPYSSPGYAQQKNGSTPLLDCVNTPDCIGDTFPYIEPPLVLDAGNSGKVYGAWLHAGRVYLTTGTPLQGTGAATYDSSDGSWAPIDQRTGVAWFVVRPTRSYAGPSFALVKDGYLAVKGANLTYPSIVVGRSGAGAIGATLTGPDYYPSAVVARFAPGKAPKQVQITGAGVGPNDGFTGTALGGYDPRWGDYGQGTVLPDGTMWFGSEYIAQSCTDQEFANDDTCGYTRSFYANWSTHVTGIRPLR